MTVLVAHGVQVFLYRRIGYESGLGLYTGNAATLAVVFFFVISGFFITTSIIRNHARNGRFDAGQFVRSRLFRLYPPLAFSLVVCGAVYLIVAGFGLHGAHSYRFPEDLAVARERAEFSWSETVATLTFSARLFWSNVPVLNGPLWSLMWEFWYYCVALGSAIALINRSWSAALATGGLLFALYHAADPLAFRLSGIWAGGAILAVAFHQGLPSISRWPLQATGIGGFLYLLGTHATRFDSDPAKYAWACIFVAALVEILRRPQWASRVRPTLSRLNMGRSSYTLYVLHFPLLLLCYSMLGPKLRFAGAAEIAGVLLLLIVLVTYLAILCSHFLEPMEHAQHAAKPCKQTASTGNGAAG